MLLLGALDGAAGSAVASLDGRGNTDGHVRLVGEAALYDGPVAATELERWRLGLVLLDAGGLPVQTSFELVNAATGAVLLEGATDPRGVSATDDGLVAGLPYRLVLPLEAELTGGAAWFTYANIAEGSGCTAVLALGDPAEADLPAGCP